VNPGALKGLTAVEAAVLTQRLPDMTLAEKMQLMDMLEERERRSTLDTARSSMLGHAHHLYPGFKEGAHHRTLSAIFEDVLSGKKKRVIINIAPRMGKSEFSSYLFPSRFIGRFPEKKIIMGTHTSGLSEDFGRRVKNLVDTEEYQELYPGTQIAADQKAAGKWSTSAGGQYYAVGVGGSIAGRGADLFVIDDPHSEQDVKTNSTLAFDSAWSWFQTGPLQRLMPGGAIIIIMTRWSKKDLTGRLIDHQIKNPDSDQWEIIELPAILHEDTDHEKSLWPEQWPLEELKSKKAGMDPQFWNAQYMQQPTSDKSAIIARTSWKIWTGEKPPKVEFVIQSWDTAFEAKQSADYSACTTWGVWYDTERNNQPSLILLDAFKDRMEFPELKATALKHYKEWKPDAFIVEKKAAGAPLIQELRRAGIPVQEFSPSRGNDKIVRLNAVSDFFATGIVWAPDTRWAKEVIEEVASFPNGDHDDYVDTVSQALLRYRQGGFIPLDSDEQDEAEQRERHRHKSYY
jgi:predicted phage terminase large subunit-like protein